MVGAIGHRLIIASESVLTVHQIGISPNSLETIVATNWPH